MRTQEGGKILIIDDERSVRENIAAYLEDSDFVVYQAENGRVGLEMFREINPDVILVDIDMPEVNGFEVLKAVRQKSDEIPVVMVSGAGEVTNAIEASRLGAWDFVLKPIHNMAVVEHIIGRVQKHRELLRENREYKEDLEKKVKERTLSLQLRTNELQAANIQLKDEIEERRLAEARLRQAKERSVALRRFSNRISEFNDEARLLGTALEELCTNIYLSGAALFHSFKRDRLTRFAPGIPPCDFLNKLPTFDFIRSVFHDRSQEIVVYNNVPENSPLAEFYKEHELCSDDITGGHFAFLRGKSLHHHLFVFYRDALYAPFFNLDIEYMKSMINEINIAYGNIQVITANSWLEKRLKSTVPADRQNVLLERHHFSGFDLATSVFPSYEIKAEWHHPISVDGETTAILMSDIPGPGMSDVMYNEMATELLVKNREVIRTPHRVMEILNDELQTDFHPNRFLTMNYFLAHSDGEISYNSLGYDTMPLVHFRQDGYSVHEPKASPFVQIYTGHPGDFFRKEKAVLEPGDLLFGYTRRLIDGSGPREHGMNGSELLDLIRGNMALPAAELMERVILFLRDSYPKALQSDDINLILFKRT